MDFVSGITIALGDSRGEEITGAHPQALTAGNEHENPNLYVADSELEAIKNSAGKS